MKIEFRCSCGATGSWTDEAGVYAKEGAGFDAKGRRYLIEVRADEWLAAHAGCTEIAQAKASLP